VPGSRAEEHRLRREEGNARVRASGHRGIQRLFALDGDAYRDAALPGRTKELLGLVSSLTLRCDDCVAYHLDRCVEEGWSREEIVDALSIGLVVGGSIVIPHLRRAFEVLDDLLPEEDA
jgi:AhpD family alkylhydroperoxidase